MIDEEWQVCPMGYKRCEFSEAETLYETEPVNKKLVQLICTNGRRECVASRSYVGTSYLFEPTGAECVIEKELDS